MKYISNTSPVTDGNKNMKEKNIYNIIILNIYSISSKYK